LGDRKGYQICLEAKVSAKKSMGLKKRMQTEAGEGDKSAPGVKKGEKGRPTPCQEEETQT